MGCDRHDRRHCHDTNNQRKSRSITGRRWVRCPATRAEREPRDDLQLTDEQDRRELLEQHVRAAAGPRAYLPGPVFGSGYRGLQSGAAVYVHATEVGGTHPALIEALGAGNLCLVLDTPENREVVGSAGVLFSDQESLERALRWAAALDPEERATWQERARRHASVHFSWDAVAAAYLALLRGDESR